MKKKNEIPQLEQYKIFKMRLIEDARSYNITLDRNLETSLNLLLEAVNKAIFELENPVPETFQKKILVNDRQKFIAIYNSRYLQTYDFEPTMQIDGVRIKMIDVVVEKIKKVGGTIDDFMAFFFDEHLPNAKITANIGFIVSAHVFDEYCKGRKDIFKKQKEIEIREKIKSDLYNRFKILIRVTDHKDIRMNAWIKEYQAGDISLEEFKTKIIEAEERYKDLLAPHMPIEANTVQANQ